MKHKRFFLSLTATLVLALGAIGVGVYILNRPHPAIPASIQQQLDFKPFYLGPVASNIAQIDTASVKFDPQDKLLSYNVNLKATTVKLTVSQQATPINFSEIPDLYTHLVAGLQQYSSFTSKVGTVYLTHPPKNNAGHNQTAVMNNQGVLMFVRSDQDLSDTQWQQFFNELTQ